MAVIEICAFRLGGDEEAFLVVDATMQTEFSYQQPGLLRRTTARDGDTWAVVTTWVDAEAAERAERAEDGDAVAQAFHALIDSASLRRSRFTTLE